MPLSRLINDPLGTVLGVENVKKNVKFDAIAKEQNGRFQAR
jgi:hypothetical protein